MRAAEVPDIVLLTHSDSDLATLGHCTSLLPEDFPNVSGFSLQAIATTQDMVDLLTSTLATSRVLVVRVLGRPDSIAGWPALLRSCRDRHQSLLVVSGTGEPSPELDSLSTVSPMLLSETLTYLQFGGAENLANWLRQLSDQLLLTGYGYEPPQPLPEHGLYHPALGDSPSLETWLARHSSGRPAVGITFYRAQRLSGNLRFIDTLIEALERMGLDALPVYTSSLRAPSTAGGSAALDFFRDTTGARIEALINTTSFAAADVDCGVPARDSGQSIFSRLDVPVFQAIVSGMERPQWASTARGLNPIDTAMNVVLPEFDGRLITVPISFKERHQVTGLQIIDYAPVEDRVVRLAGLVAAHVRLRRLPPGQRRVAFVLTNSTSKSSQIGNAVGLDAPASLLRLLQAMKHGGYTLDTLPESGDALIHALIDAGSYDTEQLTAEQCSNAVGRVGAARYDSWFQQLPSALREHMKAQWGEPPGAAYVHDGHLVLAGLSLGNALIVLQPPRGYGMDPDAIYHRPDLPPTHHYHALYRWIEEDWGAHAMVHVGKHGTLEWLPGKGVGLSQNCFPDAVLGNLPLFYPFILNDPGEGAQAKRRAHAAIVDHLTPPMTTADTYGVLAQLGELVDEYYQVETLDPTKLPLLQAQIWELVKQARLDQDLDLIVADDHDHPEGPDSDYPDTDHPDSDHADGVDPAHDNNPSHIHPDHEHWDDTPNERGVPMSLARMDGVAFSHLIQDIDGYLCEIGAAQIRSGLHILGQVPEGEALTDMLCSLTRIPNIGAPSLPAELARHFGLDYGLLLTDKGHRLDSAPVELEARAQRSIVTRADALESIEDMSKALFAGLQSHNFSPQKINDVLHSVLGATESTTSSVARVLGFACTELVPGLRQTTQEVDQLLRGLDGRYIPPGPSGAPTRGMAHVLPTGRNFYSVDPRNLPSQAAWHVGQQLAREVLRRHWKETGRFPESVSISIWGTSAMRTHGDDTAEILALLGVRPVWQSQTRRLAGVEVIPLAELNRPRVDVTIRISGFFRDAFPQLIELLDQAVSTVIALDEPLEQNFIRKHYLRDVAAGLAADTLPAKAAESARYRIFGCKPGSYGAGILPLITEKNWRNEADFAEAYVNWGGYAYTSEHSGVDARPEFRQRLASVEVALHNQDNREHDIFDSDDYLQFHGGMIATIRSLTGRKPRHYFGDTQNPDRAQVRDLKEEALRVFRSRVVNPKWLQSIQRHGYKGALECTATVDYLFGFDATADIMEDWMYEQVAQHYAFDPQMQAFFQESNPWALNAIAERLLEAAQRHLWKEPPPETLEALRDTLLQSEAILEARGESARRA